MKKSKSTNPVLLKLIEDLNTKAREERRPIWRDLAKRMSKSAKGRARINISRICRHTKDNDTVVVPGKVLASGSINHPIIIAAFDFSAQAREKIISAGGKCISLQELIKMKTVKNPRIMV